MAVASRAPLSAINTAAGPSTRRTNPSNSRRPRANEPIASSSNMSSSKTNSPPPEDDYVIALHDFSPAPPNAQCLSFLAGQVIHVLNRDATGWWDGELEGKRGWFPSNYVKSDIGNLGDDLANGILRVCISLFRFSSSDRSSPWYRTLAKNREVNQCRIRASLSMPPRIRIRIRNPQHIHQVTIFPKPRARQ
jgi:hypothetical protein